jgi:hypothetical protein
MSSDEPQTAPLWKNWKIVGLAAALFVIVVVFPLLIVGSSQTKTTAPSAASRGTDESTPLDTARAALQRQTDLATCRAALQQINNHLGAARDRPRAGLSDEQAAHLRELFDLDEGELAEVRNSNYTPLDGQYLDLCFLLRDAARSLEIKGLPNGPDGKPIRPSRLDQASAAFAWVARQLRLGPGDEPVPPAYALRRGWGQPGERATVFLNLLEQLAPPEGAGGAAGDLLGCLVLCPGKDGKPRLWACGVVVGDGPDVYLFDPRLGLPLPGPKGQGVATLGAVCKDPTLLAPLTADEKHPYDVTGEQAKGAELLLYRPLSALAPRMRLLQDHLLGPALHVRLAADADRDLGRLKAAAKAQGLKEGAVSVWKEGGKLLRDFLPPDEGGVDKPQPFPLRALRGFTTPNDPSLVHMGRMQRFTFGLVPWTAYPPEFRDPARFHFGVELGQRVHMLFADPFISPVLAPNRPRDLLLRGRFTEATRKLVEEQEEVLPQAQRRANAQGLDRRVQEWVQKALGAYAAQLRARGGHDPAAQAAADQEVAEVWKQAEPVLVLLQGAMAGPRGAELVYQLGLCTHERADRLQERLDLLARATGAAPGKSETARAQEAWKDALRWWGSYAEDYPRGPAAAAARRLRGQAQLMLGDRGAAAATWSAVPDDMTDLEKVAAVYLARQAKQK